MLNKYFSSSSRKIEFGLAKMATESRVGKLFFQNLKAFRRGRGGAMRTLAIHRKQNKRFKICLNPRACLIRQSLFALFSAFSKSPAAPATLFSIHSLAAARPAMRF